VKLRFTPEARRQYLLALAEILDGSPRAALAFHERVARALGRLELAVVVSEGRPAAG
jgi:hypothetical protein